jgi:hypothetical protein
MRALRQGDLLDLLDRAAVLMLEDAQHRPTGRPG